MKQQALCVLWGGSHAPLLYPGIALVPDNAIIFTTKLKVVACLVLSGSIEGGLENVPESYTFSKESGIGTSRDIPRSRDA